MGHLYLIEQGRQTFGAIKQWGMSTMSFVPMRQ
jgi:hypothetical protein